MRDLNVLVADYKDRKCLYMGTLLDNFCPYELLADKKYSRVVVCFKVQDEDVYLRCSKIFSGIKREVRISKTCNYDFLRLDKIPELKGDLYLRTDLSGFFTISTSPSDIKIEVHDGFFGSHIRFPRGMFSPGVYYIFNVAGEFIFVPRDSANFVFLFYSIRKRRLDLNSVVSSVSWKFDDLGNFVDMVTFFYDDMDVGWFGLKKARDGKIIEGV